VSGLLTALLAAALPVVSAGLLMVARAVWKAAQDMRDNKTATQANTRALDSLKALMETRISVVEERVWHIERYLSRGQGR
jgi:hypothetical protein